MPLVELKTCHEIKICVKSSRLFAPLLEESLALAAAVGAPQVAATRRVLAAAVGPVVAVGRSSDARASKNINEGRTSGEN